MATLRGVRRFFGLFSASRVQFIILAHQGTICTAGIIGSCSAASPQTAPVGARVVVCSERSPSLGFALGSDARAK